MDEVSFFVVIPRGQRGNNAQYSRFAIRGSRRPLRTLKAYITRQRLQGNFPGEVYIQKSKAESAPYPPQFESKAKIFEYPVENGTGLEE